MKSSFGKTSAFQQGLTNKTGLLSLSALLLNSVYYHNTVAYITNVSKTLSWFYWSDWITIRL